MLNSFSGRILLSCAGFTFLCFSAASAQPSTDQHAAAQSCSSWSALFDSVDDREIAETLRQHREQGWDPIIQEGEKLGIGLSRQIEDGERQLEISRSAEERAQNGLSLKHRTAVDEGRPPDCSDPSTRETNLTCQLRIRHNEVLALQGMLDLLRCRIPAHPALPVRHDGSPIATISVTVTPDDEHKSQSSSKEKNTTACPCDEQLAYSHALTLGMEQNGKSVRVKQGSYIVLRFKPEDKATSLSLEPGQTALQVTKGSVHFPKDVVGILKAASPGETKIVVFAGVSAENPENKNANEEKTAAEAKVIKNATRSGNWSGYAKLPGAFQTVPFQSVRGVWTEPLVAAVPGDSSDWVGVDGDISSTLIQTGTAQGFSGGFLGIGAGTFHYPWFEMLPAAETKIPMPVNPGDVMVASVAPAPGITAVPGIASVWLVTLTDTTAGWTSTTPLVYSGALVSSEWITEAPSQCGPFGCDVLPVAAFAPVTFDVGDTERPGSTVMGAPAAAAGNPGFTINDKIIMVQNGMDVSTPSGPDCDADGFTVAFGSLPPAAPGPFFSTLTLPPGSTGNSYSATLAVGGLSSPTARTFSAASAQLPPGLTLNSSSGTISGVPSQAGNFQFDAIVTDTGTTATCGNQISVRINRSFRFPRCIYDPTTKKLKCF